MARIVVRSGAGVGRSCEVTDTILVGRDPLCDLVVEDTLISRRHLRVRATPTGYTAEDLRTTNGTRLNGVPIMRAQLHPGDELQVGECVLAFEAEQPDPDASTVTLSVIDSHIQAAVPAAEGYGASAEATIDDLREQLNLFCQVGEALGSAVGLDELLHRILGELFRVFEQAERGFVILAKSPQGPIDVRAKHFRRRGEGEVTLSRTIIEHVLSRREAVLSRDAAEDDRFAGAGSIIRHQIRSMVCAPLVCANEVLGAIHIDTTDRDKPFTEAEVRTLVGIAPQAALAVRQAQLVEEHVESQRLAAIGQTVAGLAHCVKNILNGMRGGSYILDRALGAGDADRVQQGWAMVKRNSAFMSDLVMDMLSYAREREPVHEAVDPCQFLEAVRDLVNVRAGDREVELTCQVEPGLGPVRMDATAMKRCLLNLAVNAVEACDKETGRVCLRCGYGPERQTVHFTVTDNGCGIPREQRDKLFGMFFSTKGSKGTGLGLPVCKKIVEEHGGTIGVTSTAGEGTEFTVVLPAEPAGRQQDEGPPGPALTDELAGPRQISDRRGRPRSRCDVTVMLTAVGADEGQRARAVDVSQEGVGLGLSAPVGPGTECQLTIGLPDGSVLSNLPATIVWCDPAVSGERATHRVGLVFRRLSPEDRAAISALV